VRLYVNGVLAATNEAPLDWRPNPPPPLKNLLGRSLVKEANNANGDTDLNGQMDEIRLWAGERTEAQIRDNMFRALTGTEPRLLGLWNFESVANGVVKDASPGGHDGRLMGNARVIAEPPPASERILQLDGTNSYVELPPHILDGLKEATIKGWVKWRRFDNWPRFFTFGTGENRVGLMAGNNTNRIDLIVDEKLNPWVGQNIVVDNALTAGEWVHVACVFTTNGTTLLVNGRTAGTKPDVFLSNVKENTENFLGISPDLNNASALNGQMDEVRLWNVARTTAQIQEGLSKSLTGSEPGLVAPWNFNVGTARDVTGHGHDGILRVTPSLPSLHATCPNASRLKRLRRLPLPARNRCSTLMESTAAWSFHPTSWTDFRPSPSSAGSNGVASSRGLVPLLLGKARMRSA
jgi:hypothetical protein